MMRCPHCDTEMELIAKYVELDFDNNDYYFKCYECGYEIDPVYPDIEALKLPPEERIW